MSASPAVARRIRHLRKSILDSLPSFSGNQFPGSQTGAIFNGLLNMAQEENPDDPILSKFEPLDEEGISCGVDAASLIAMLDQILVVVEAGSEAPAVSSPPLPGRDLLTEQW